MDNIILGGLIGFLSATATTFITTYLQNKKDTKKFYREKMEEIFILTDKSRHYVITTQSSILNENIKPDGKFDDSNSKLAMLIQYYAPEIEKEYQEYLKIWFDTGNYLIQETLKQNTNNNNHIENMQRFEKSYLKFKNKLRNEATKYI